MLLLQKSKHQQPSSYDSELLYKRELLFQRPTLLTTSSIITTSKDLPRIMSVSVMEKGKFMNTFKSYILQIRKYPSFSSLAIE